MIEDFKRQYWREMRFFGNGCNGGDGRELFTRNRGTGMGGGLVFNGRWGIFKVSPLFYEAPLSHILPTTLFSNFVHPPPFPVISNPNSHCSFCCPVFCGWMGDHTTFNVLFYVMMIWTYTCVKPQGPVDWHTHKNIYLHHFICAHSSYLNYIIKW